MPVTESDLHQLCQACGLCCDGSLFGFFDLEANKEAMPLRLGNPPDRAGPLVFLQPCSALVEGGCSCYAQRPEACRGYACKTFRAVQAGELAPAEAMERVLHIRQRSQEVRRQLLEALSAFVTAPLDGEDLTTLNTRLRKVPGKTPEQGRALLAYVILTRHLDQYFRDEAGLKFT